MFLQTENHQPFYVRLGEKNYSSSSNGYLILSKLKDSAYSFAVGFPQNQFPEQSFSVTINKKDRGFEVKNLGAQGWALFDLQTLQLIHAVKPAAASGGAAYNLIKKDDGFARLMAGVVNDTAVMYTVVMEEKKAAPVLVSTQEPKKEQPKKQDSVVAKIEQPEKTDSIIAKADKPKKKDSIVAKIEEPKKTDSAVVKKEEPKKADSAIAKTQQPELKDTVVAKVEEHKKKDSVIAKVEEPKKTDTLAIVQKTPERDPVKDPALNPPALPVIHVVNQFKSDSGYHMVFVDEVKDSIRIFIPGNVQIKTIDSTVSLPAKEAITDTSKTASRLFMSNSDCRNFATTNDVDKLRVKLITEKDSEARIGAAKKAFKSKCYSALQIKALSEMFPYDEQKFKFFEAAYPFVSDSGNFKSLVSLLTDPVYVQRFRKMVRLD